MKGYMKKLIASVGMVWVCAVVHHGNANAGVVAGAAVKGDTVSVEAVKGESQSLLPSGLEFKLVWNDEFNGTKLDESKWSFRTNFWGQEAYWFAKPEDNAVEVKDGKLALKLVKRADGQFVSPQLQTGEIIWDIPFVKDRKSFWPLSKRQQPKFEHRYGYYECRCRLQQKPGWWSAFWMQTSTQGCCLDPARAGIEHDIMESFEPGEILPACFHMNGYGDDYVGFDSIRGPGDYLGMNTGKQYVTKVDKTVYHTFGFLWEPDGYTLYRDGKRISPKLGKVGNEAVSQVPEFVLLTTEAKWFRKNKMTGPADPDLAGSVGDDFVVDYVRVYDIVK